MRRRSPKRQAEFDQLPAIRSISIDRSPRRPTDESFREFVRRLPCVVCLRPSLRGDPCHLHTKRVAGDWLKRDGQLVGNIYPACRRHHNRQHSAGIETFATAHGLDLELLCEVIGRAYRLGWSTEGLGAAARRAGYLALDVTLVIDGELPY